MLHFTEKFSTHLVVIVTHFPLLAVPARNIVGAKREVVVAGLGCNVTPQPQPSWHAAMRDGICTTQKVMETHLVVFVPDRRCALVLAVPTRDVVGAEREVVVTGLGRDSAAPALVAGSDASSPSLLQHWDHTG